MHTDEKNFQRTVKPPSSLDNFCVGTHAVTGCVDALPNPSVLKV